MIRLKAFSIFLLAIIFFNDLWAQNSITGKVLDAENRQPIAKAQIYIPLTSELFETEVDGSFTIATTLKDQVDLVVFVHGYHVLRTSVSVNQKVPVIFEMRELSTELSEVVITQKREEIFNLGRLNPVEGTAIYAGKKSEVVMVDNLTFNLSANNARQIYAQVVGLNIYENNDAGLQLNVGGRGLDPNRTSNFNTRQNGYDISADVLGYPESYYTPPAEALEELQIVRGAASLQYGTQFGGLINFKFKKPSPTDKIQWVSRQSLGSFNLFTSFNSLSGSTGKFSYYTYFNYKRSDGYRPNSSFTSKNFFGTFNYALSSKTELTFEATYLNYLSKQPGGLTDSQFNANPKFSNRSRNWFEVDWKLFALKLSHKFTQRSKVSLNLFGLNASRNALGYRGDPKRPERNPITEPDDDSFVRDLIKGTFSNWGAELRYLTRFNLGDTKSVLLLGSKYYQSYNTSEQGPGTSGREPDFSFNFTDHIDYPNQSSFVFPNRNFALFGENIFQITKDFSITPGFRVEYIKTESEGEYAIMRYDNAGNLIYNQDTTDNRLFERSFVLLGVGASFTGFKDMEIYGNISQNYRSVTFSDIRVVNPTFIIDPNISDEKGFTSDLGIRGKLNEDVSFDAGVFSLLYNNRIGTILANSGPNKGDRVRKNIGDALIYGVEAFVDWNAASFFALPTDEWRLSPFVNIALTDSRYISSEENNVTDKKVEFIPAINLKTGLKFGYKNLMGSVFFTRLSEQYTDAQNTPAPQPGDSREGIIGEIPAYHIMDVSLSYTHKKMRFESGVNNILDQSYFTRRATGYPGPGIIPSDPRSFYLAVQFIVD